MINNQAAEEMMNVLTASKGFAVTQSNASGDYNKAPRKTWLVQLSRLASSVHLAWLTDRWQAAINAREIEDVFKQLHKLSPHLLNDIGLKKVRESDTGITRLVHVADGRPLAINHYNARSVPC